MAIDIKNLNVEDGLVLANNTVELANHYIHQSFTMIENASPQYILLCRNLENNNVNGRIQINRTSGNYQASNLDIVVTSGASIGMQGGSLISNQVYQQSIPSEEKYDLVTLTRTSDSTSWVAVRYVGNTFPNSVATFTGYLLSSSSGFLTTLTAADVNSVVLFNTKSKVNFASSNVEIQENTILTIADEGSGNGLDADLLDSKHASDFVLATEKGAASGVATLDAAGFIPSSQLGSWIRGGIRLSGTLNNSTLNTMYNIMYGITQGWIYGSTAGISSSEPEEEIGRGWVASEDMTLIAGSTLSGHAFTIKAPGDEGDNTVPIDLEAGDMLLLTGYSYPSSVHTWEFTIINNSDARFANYLPLSGGTMTGALTLPPTGVLHNLRYNFTSGQAASRNWFVGNDAFQYGAFNISTETAQGNNTLLSRFHINSSGNVGIGTTSPARLLTLTTSSNDDGIQIRRNSGTTNDYASLSFRISGVEAADPQASIRAIRTNAVNSGDTDLSFVLEGTGGDLEKMRITSGGNVGIGTTSLDEKLEVNGNAKATRFISTQATGTSPLSVTSTTVNTNLNADLLDDKHASDFILATEKGAANGVTPLDSTSKVPLANLPDFITGASRGFYLRGTISGNVSLSGTGGLVDQLDPLSGGDYENCYGYMWVASSTVTLSWTDQTTLGPNYTYYLLIPGDEGDATSPVTLEAGDMVVFTKYTDAGGDSNDFEFTFSIINNSDPRFANYLPLTGGTMTGDLTIEANNPVLTVNGADTGTAMIKVNGDSQGTGAIEVAQSTTYGGGMSYNGDGSPAFVSGETADHITFYRLNNGTRSEVFHYPYNSDVVNFNATPTVSGTSVSLVGHTHTVANITDLTATAAELNLLDGVTATTSELNILDGVTATTSELNILDGITATTAELNILDGVTADTTELNYVDGVTSAIQTQLDGKAASSHLHGNILSGGTITSATVTPADQDRILIADNSNSGKIERGIIIGTGTTTFLRNDGTWATPADSTTLTGLGVTATASELNVLDGITSTTAELNILDGVTATASELNVLDGITATTAELNILDGVTADATELNYVDGVTSSIQTQLNSKLNLSGGTLTGNLTISKTEPILILNDTNTSQSNYPRVRFDTSTGQGVELYHTEFDVELPVGGYGLVLGPSPNNTQFGTTGTLSLAVLGEIYTGSTALGTTQKVFHDGYHPNADVWTTGRTITIGSTGKTVNGSGNVSWSLADIGAAASSHSHTAGDLPATTVIGSTYPGTAPYIYNPTTGAILYYSAYGWATTTTPSTAGLAASTHSHSISEVTNLQTSLDAKANLSPTTDTKTGNYTLAASDAGKVLRINSSSNLTVTVPLNTTAAIEVNAEIAIIRYGTGTVTLSPAVGVTLNSVNTNRKIKDRYGSAALKKIATNEWILVGSLEA